MQLEYKRNSSTLQAPTSGRSNHRLASFLLAVGMLVASGCSVPFGGGGDDISAEVDVGGSSSNLKSSEVTRETQQAEAGSLLDVDDAPASDSPAASPIEGDDADPTTTALAPRTSVDTRFSGRSMQYVGIDLQLGDFITTNLSLEEYLGSQPPTDDDEVLLVEVAVTNRSTGTVSVPSSVLGLRLASGEWIPATEMRETEGDSLSTVRPATQATERVVLEFPVTDLAGASFEISEATTIAEFIPLTAEASVVPPSTIELPGEFLVAELESPSLWPSCGYIWTGEVLSARVAVEGVDGRRAERAAKGQRWVAVEMRTTYDATTVTGWSPCDDYGLGVSEINPRLVIDGIPESSVNSISGDRLDVGTAVVTEFWFQIPVETQEMALTDIDGTVIAAWVLDLPPARGEG